MRRTSFDTEPPPRKPIPPPGNGIRYTPIHIFSCVLPNGAHRKYVIPGNYCDAELCAARLQARRPTWTINSRTWRGDWQYIGYPANSEPGYQAGLHNDLKAPKA